MDRMLPLITKTNYCWIWMGGRNKGGYGRIFFQNEFWLVHRLMYVTVTGEDITDKIVRHYVCDNPPCCNPDHLRKGTRPDNTQDMVDKNRHAHGETSYARLTEAQALTVLSDPRRHHLIAIDYNVSRRTIGHIKTGRTWKHLPR